MSTNDPIQIKDKRNHPFCIVETPVLVDEALSTYDKMIYVVLCSFASARNQKCFPSVSTIAGRASCSERQVRRALTVLEQRGYIERDFSLGHATTYGILDLPETPATQSGVTDSPDTPAPQSGEGGLTVRHNKKSLTRIKEQEKDYSPSGSGGEPPADEPEPENSEECLPVSEAPAAMKSTAEILLFKTGRKGLTGEEISALRKLNATHFPSRVQAAIDVAVERFPRLNRPLSSLTFCYIAEMLEKQQSRSIGKGKSPPGQRAAPREREDYSDLNV